MMDAIERAVPGPQAEVIMHGASGGQVFGKTAPLAASAENVHHAVDHLAHAALAAATLARRNQRLDMRPSFLIGQVARIAQRLTVVAPRFSAVHIGHLTRRIGTLESHLSPTLQEATAPNRFVRLTKCPDGHLDTANDLSIVTLRWGCSELSASSEGEPIKKSPAGTTIICGQLAHSLNLSPAPSRCSADADSSVGQYASRSNRI